jgi:hypothetical protein
MLLEILERKGTRTILKKRKADKLWWFIKSSDTLQRIRDSPLRWKPGFFLSEEMNPFFIIIIFLVKKL